MHWESFKIPCIPLTSSLRFFFSIKHCLAVPACPNFLFKLYDVYTERNNQTLNQMFLWMHHFIKWKYFNCDVHHFIHISSKFSLTYLATLESPHEFIIMLSCFKHCLLHIIEWLNHQQVRVDYMLEVFTCTTMVHTYTTYKTQTNTQTSIQ